MDRGSTLVFSIVFLTLTVLSSIPALAAENHVANFSAGQPGTSGYEHFAFWIREDKKNEIIYSYGKDSKEVKVAYIGPGSQGNEPCFTIKFSNGYVLNLTPKGSALVVTDSEGRYSKAFQWEYEGPIEGKGTFCDVCVDENEAVRFVRDNFMSSGASR
jgi:hypothetical protein